MVERKQVSVLSSYAPFQTRYVDLKEIHIESSTKRQVGGHFKVLIDI